MNRSLDSGHENQAFVIFVDEKLHHSYSGLNANKCWSDDQKIICMTKNYGGTWLKDRVRVADMLQMKKILVSGYVLEPFQVGNK